MFHPHHRPNPLMETPSVKTKNLIRRLARAECMASAVATLAREGHEHVEGFPAIDVECLTRAVLKELRRLLRKLRKEEATPPK
jgi:hypothetical protein